MGYRNTRIAVVIGLLSASPALACPPPPVAIAKCAEPLAIVNEGADFIIVRRAAAGPLPPSQVAQKAARQVGSSVWLDAAIARIAPLPSAFAGPTKDHAQ
ncbi:MULTISPECIES: hypothetical protein [unclassified Novosphingobium]|uniref:hypothetical protein n=1 Tax=unclassified Novosphingobium TaxID=2644732 RepID=UPI000D4C32F2|nr:MULTISPECIES: hypothetical protein [unclassified Novosphingobium]PTR12595.1 hypothetical protein C8K11_10248 [Novosphingobium sp. GV055]PUB06379.1 hypothetical protein C8K12_10248 [Novosphingobium sp. GV061]PUB22430.1 hypothetical protein C8K14_10248 [Novosphingobium sp. GV079]PUB44455.1 hypothetical protein C8K10_10248 [Novosphingobium sp. GV027]